VSAERKRGALSGLRQRFQIFRYEDGSVG
jgi:hypothetical protein